MPPPGLINVSPVAFALDEPTLCPDRTRDDSITAFAISSINFIFIASKGGFQCLNEAQVNDCGLVTGIAH